MATPHQTRPDHDDPLTLNEYGLPELRSSLHTPPAIGTSPTAMMASFSDYSMTFGQNQTFNPAYEKAHPTIKTDFRTHRGSISNMSDEMVSAGSGAHPHRLSIGSPGNYGPDDHDTSPESAAALGILAIGDTTHDGSALSMKLDESVSGDGVDGSTTSRKDKDGNQDTPSWAEMKTKAGKDRKRLPLACIACRRKKIRCSGEKPACKHCLRSRIPCVYKVTTRKAAPRTDYMAMLDKRLRRMEDRVIKLIPKESLPSVSGVGRSVVKPALPGAPPKTPAAKKRAADEAFGNELDDWSKSKSANPDVAGSGSRTKDADDSTLLTEGLESLPPKDIQEHLAEVYFDYVYGQSYPLLHKPSFMRRLASGNVPPVLILAICAISARFSTHPQLRTEPCFLRGDNWAERARQIALKRYDAPNITILIVYLILGLHEFGTCQGGRSWMFGGMAQRMAYALQLHKELEYDPSVVEGERKPLGLIDREIRRRTMWSCFLMDRFNSSGTDRPLFVNEQYIEVQLPVKEHLFLHEIQAPTEDLEGKVPNPVPPDSGQLANARDNMGVSAYTIRLVCIWGKLIKYMNLGGKERELEPMWSSKSTFFNIRKEAREFKDSLPEMLLYSPENLKSHAIGKTANQFLYIHIFFQQIILFMHRFSLPSKAGSRPPKDMPHDFLTESARTALDAANQISILINEAMEFNVVAPFAGYSAFFSSTVHVHGVFSKNPKLEAQSKKYLAYNVKYLSKMKKYWGMFHYIAENLKELYRQHADAQLRGSTGGVDKKGKAVIFQYGDWFDRYPHGVSKTDYEDAAESNANEPGTDAVLGQKSDLQSVEEFFASLSPPQRAEQQRKQARKNKSKSVSKVEASPLTHAETTQRQQQQHTSQQMHPTQQLHQINHIHIAPQDALDASAFDPSYFTQPTPQPQPYLADYPHPHAPPPLPLLSTSPTSLVHPSHVELSPFPDLSAHHPHHAPNNAAFWNLDPMGMGGSGFFDPSNAWFLPFNMEPPTLGDDGVFGGAGQAPFDFGFCGFVSALFALKYIMIHNGQMFGCFWTMEMNELDWD
ncbi:fungal-specific transcription factor domain-containing protein [Massariosphaeria phaeospora]|uniref:Fungal-specific transcription factor domain-containing protein n=1 Tax=Massariosphaeria phaeospora TaxID=100035 RepID=A0A7C8ME16_9PLEO|nr:fungal-specific transcription factor domain-containing protein [Massariosphaeria phaeospora]